MIFLKFDKKRQICLNIVNVKKYMKNQKSGSKNFCQNSNTNVDEIKKIVRFYSLNLGDE